MNKNPYDVLLRRHVTEKTMMLQRLHTEESNRSLSRCKTPKCVFIVDRNATKADVARAVKIVYDVDVIKVNMIQVKSKPTRRMRKGVRGQKSAFKKAIVTLKEGDQIDGA